MLCIIEICLNFICFCSHYHFILCIDEFILIACFSFSPSFGQNKSKSHDATYECHSLIFYLWNDLAYLIEIWLIPNNLHMEDIYCSKYRYCHFWEPCVYRAHVDSHFLINLTSRKKIAYCLSVRNISRERVRFTLNWLKTQITH